MIELVQNTLYKKVFDHINMSGDLTSDAIPIQGIGGYAIQSSWTDFTNTGTVLVAIQGSNDEDNWNTVLSFVPSGATGGSLLNVEKAHYRFVRIVYTAGTTTGDLFITISGKII